MTVIDLSDLQSLNEGVYSDAVLNEIISEFDQNNPGTLKWLDIKFTLEGHQVRDRFFPDGDDRLNLLVESIKGVQGDLKLDDTIWFDMPCSVRLTQDVINGRKYWHTHDWKWDLSTYQQRVLKSKQTDTLSYGTGQRSLLEDMKDQPKASNDGLFTGISDKGGDN